ncbi:MAG TPA: class I SAM-dependent methyltransferase [Polyangiaceae bacterium]|nr:class I SAM-dependent methyltransferase [Polyangiaceae bacterium]
MSDATSLFGPRAGDYARSRPSYPEALFDELAAGPLGLPPPADVAEIGSGTGLFAEALLARGYRVLAVEPNGPMREAAEKRLGGAPGFVSVDGRAEATALPDASADLVVAAQALHWFEREGALAEMRRVARPPRRALFVWNVGDRDASPFMREYHALACEFAPGTAFNQDPSSFDALVASYAGGAERRDYRHEQPLDREGLVGRLRSAASAPKPGEPRDGEMRARLSALFDAHERAGRVAIAYRCVAYFAGL